MQYIQLHPQIASEVPSPQAGTLNFFLDAADNFVKIKTDQGVIVTSASPYLTGGTYNDYTITFTDNFGSQVPISGLTGIYLTGGTFSNNSIILNDSNNNSITITGLSSNSVIEVTYSELVDKITTSALTTGGYYLITDFRTCYDQPDFNFVGNPITTGNYKESDIQPIMVFATSVSTISIDAYQPTYPNDKIQYDWTYSATEVTNEVAYGRITERIDEFNNRTDYDHREVLFKRYDNYYYTEKDIAEGTIEVIESTGEVIGTETVFSNYNTGDYIAIPSTNVTFFEIVSISSDTSMVVSGLTIPAVSEGASFYLAQKTGLTYKQNNISVEYTEHPTFLLETETIISNYIGDVAILRNWNEYDFLLPNNVFGEDVIGNRIGNNFINNTFSRDVEHNVIGDDFENNTIYNDSDFLDNQIAANFRNNLIICDSFNDNVIGDNFNNNKIFNNINFVDNQISVGFNDNTIYNDFEDNKIGNGFGNNVIDGSFNNNSIGNQFDNNDIYREFYYNSIGHYFNTNTIYSDFYRNEILNNFSNNLIGDSGNLDNFEFYSNRIGNDFNDNTIRQYFYDNQIGKQFESNILNGNFYTNVIGNYFNSNPNIGYDFYGNHIGNEFNNNELIGDYFHDNQIGEYFNDNSISYLFNNNQIGNTFENNTLGDTDYFNWDNTSIENLTGRTYNTFYNSLYGDDGNNNLGNVILGKELIMRFLRNSGTTITSGDLVIDETYEITNYQGGDDFSNVADVISGVINTNGCIFIATGTTPTEWSSNSELTELTSYNEYHKVKFTQWTQNNNGGGFSYERTKVYPTSESTVYFTKTNNSSVSDIIILGRLEIKRNNGGAIYNDVLENSWNQNVSPEGTEWNSIYTQPFNGSEFESNIIFNDFKGNYIRGSFGANKIDSAVGSNQFSGNTYLNNIGSLTYDNDFLGDVYGNNLAGNFYLNVIGDSFESNSFGQNTYDNTIGQDFYSNNIKEYFYDNTIGNGFQTNQIGSYFNNNTIDDYFGYGYGAPQGNKIGSNFYNNTVGEYFYNNTIPDNFTENTIGEYFQWNVVNTNIDTTDFTVNLGNITGFTYSTIGTSASDNIYIGLSGVITSGFGVNATFDIEVSGGAVIGVSGNTEGKLYLTGDTITILGTEIGGDSKAIDTISDDGVGKNGSDGTYNDLSVTGGTGTNATFDVTVISDLVDSVIINNRGNGYEINDELTIIGSLFGGTDGVDDITITVTALFDDDIVITVSGVTKPSVYEHYTCQLFERQGGDKRLSFYDENDILTITNINE